MLVGAPLAADRRVDLFGEFELMAREEFESGRERVA